VVVVWLLGGLGGLLYFETSTQHQVIQEFE
jgi:hypothetical protein